MSKRFCGELTLKESIFVLAYLTNGRNIAKAAQTAGYWGRNYYEFWDEGNRVLKRELVQETMQEMMKIAEEKLGITLEWKLKKLKKMTNTAAKDIPDNEEEVELRDPRTALDSIDMMNKIQGHYAPTKTENTDKSDEETKELLKSLVKKHEREC